MKKIISFSLVFALTGCGGETIFNSEAEDMQACIVGMWNNEGNISSVQYTEAYAEFYVYSEDGTFQYEKRAKLDYDLILLELLVGLERPVPYERVTEGVYTNDYYNFYDMTYSYVGNIIRVVYADDDGEDTTRLFTYYGPVIKDGTNHSLFVRQQTAIKPPRTEDQLYGCCGMLLIQFPADSAA